MAYVSEPVPTVSTPNRHLSDGINSNLIESEIEGGASKHNLPKGAALVGCGAVAWASDVLSRARAGEYSWIHLAARC
jgi:hypothetical protein